RWGRQAESMLATAREAAAGDVRRSWHLLRLTTSAGSAKEVRAAGVGGEVRRRQDAAWSAASRVLLRAQGRALVPWLAGQLVFAVGYVAGTLPGVGEAAGGRASVGRVTLVL